MAYKIIGEPFNWDKDKQQQKSQQQPTSSKIIGEPFQWQNYQKQQVKSEPPKSLWQRTKSFISTINPLRGAGETMGTVLGGEQYLNKLEELRQQNQEINQTILKKIKETSDPQKKKKLTEIYKRNSSIDETDLSAFQKSNAQIAGEFANVALTATMGGRLAGTGKASQLTKLTEMGLGKPVQLAEKGLSYISKIDKLKPAAKLGVYSAIRGTEGAGFGALGAITEGKGKEDIIKSAKSGFGIGMITNALVSPKLSIKALNSIESEVKAGVSKSINKLAIEDLSKIIRPEQIQEIVQEKITRQTVQDLSKILKPKDLQELVDSSILGIENKIARQLTDTDIRGAKLDYKLPRELPPREASSSTFIDNFFAHIEASKGKYESAKEMRDLVESGLKDQGLTIQSFKKIYKTGQKNPDFDITNIKGYDLILRSVRNAIRQPNADESDIVNLILSQPNVRELSALRPPELTIKQITKKAQEMEKQAEMESLYKTATEIVEEPFKIEQINQPIQSEMVELAEKAGLNQAKGISSELKPTLVEQINQPQIIQRLSKLVNKGDEFAGNIRLSKYPEAAQQEIKKIIAEGGDKYTDIRTSQKISEMKALAAIMNVDEKFVNEMTDKLKATPSELYAVRSTLEQSIKNMKELNIRYSKATPAEKMILAPQLERAWSNLETLTAGTMKGTLNAGRLLRSLKEAVGTGYDIDKLLNVIERESGSIAQLAPIEKTERISQAVLKLNDKELLKGTLNAIGPKNFDNLISLFKAGMLTNPTTHLVNIVSNTGMRLAISVKDIVQTGLDVGFSKISGKRSKSLVMFQKSSVDDISEGFRELKKILKTGNAMSKKWDTPREIKLQNKTLDNTIGAYGRYIYNLLEAADQPFFVSYYKKSLRDQAQVFAMNQKLKGKEFDEAVKTMMAYPLDDMVKQAIKDAEVSTFRQETILGKMASSIKTTSRQWDPTHITSTILETSLPFTRTPAAVATNIVEYSPIGIVSTILKQINPETRGQRQLTDSLAKTITGSGILAFGAWLASKNLATPSYPTSQKGKEMLYTTKTQEGSVFFNGAWRKVYRISPIGNLITAGAEAYNSYKKTGKTVDTLINSLLAIGKGVQDQPFLTGLQDISETIATPEKKLHTFFAKKIGGLSPSFIGAIARGIDPTVKETKGDILGILKSRIPGWSKTLPTKHTALGEETKREDPIGIFGITLGQLTNVITKQTPNNTPLIKSLIKIYNNTGETIGYPSQTIAGHKLTNKAYQEYLRITGTNIKNRLENYGGELNGNIVNKIVNEEREKYRQQHWQYLYKKKSKY